MRVEQQNVSPVIWKRLNNRIERVTPQHAKKLADQMGQQTVGERFYTIEGICEQIRNLLSNRQVKGNISYVNVDTDGRVSMQKMLATFNIWRINHQVKSDQPMYSDLVPFDHKGTDIMTHFPFYSLPVDSRRMM